MVFINNINFEQVVNTSRQVIEVSPVIINFPRRPVYFELTPDIYRFCMPGIDAQLFIKETLAGKAPVGQIGTI